MAEIPFFTKTALLDIYLRSDAAALSRDVVAAVTKAISEHPDQYTYFFSHRPNSSWARVLASAGFFRRAPALVEKNGSYFAPYWHEQEYLVSVASEVPDVVIQHVLQLEGPGYYFSRALKALESFGPDEFEGVLEKLYAWLDDPGISPFIGVEVMGLIQAMVNRAPQAAFDLFERLTRPIAPQQPEDPDQVYFRSKSRSMFPLDDYAGRTLRKTSELLRQKDAVRTAHVLEMQLRKSIEMESDVWGPPDSKFSSFWRSSIEESGQDQENEYKDQLLSALRDTLEYLAKCDEARFCEDIARLIGDENQILRRLGIYFVGEFPFKFKSIVRQLLLNREMLDEIGIHHEMFLLLEKGFPVLMPNEQEQLVNTILLGPTILQSADPAEPEDIAREKIHRDIWIRDRLWMLRSNLAGEAPGYLDSLTDRLGKPEHPDFTHWIGQAFFVSQVSPVTAAELATYPVDQLLQFLRTWTPRHSSAQREESYAALAGEVANLVLSNDRYAPVLLDIAAVESNFATALVRFPEPGQEHFVARLEEQLDLADNLLRFDAVRTSLEKTPTGFWVSFRLRLVNALEKLIKDESWDASEIHVARILSLLGVLSRDPDPSTERDQPEEGWLGHNDPMTVSINHVRPQAVAAIVDLAYRGERKGEHKAGVKLPRKLNEAVNDVLTTRVRRDLETSLAVHSVFGRELNKLYWLDSKWTAENLDEIFPLEDDAESASFFVAAWDSWVSNSFVFVEVFELLRTRYQRAIDNARRGLVTKTFDPIRNLSSHLILEFKTAGYSIASHEGQESLIARFFRDGLPEHRGQAAWTVSQQAQSDPGFWSKAKELWEWRLEEAMSSKNASDFRPEMSGFSGLLAVVPPTETVSSLWRLLEGFLPYLEDSNQWDRIWHNLETFLSTRVTTECVEVLRLYSLMHDHVATPRQYYGNEATRIVEHRPRNDSERKQLIALIDKVMRSGNFQFEELQRRLLSTEVTTSQEPSGD